MSLNIKLFSFFSGCGFLDLGFEKSGFYIAYVNDIFPPFINAYHYSRTCLNLPLPEYGFSLGEECDINYFNQTDNSQRFWNIILDAKSNSDIVGFIGGPPCPDFSIGGKNKGSEGDNGKLSESYINLICRYQPDFFVFENVKGLYKTKKHKLFFENLKNKLNISNYSLCERLTNSLEYGVPQDRDRIILIGFNNNLLSDLGIKNQKINSIFPWNDHLKYFQDEVRSYPWPSTNQFQENSLLDCPEEIPRELTVEHWFRINNVLNHPNAEKHFQPRAALNKFRYIDEGDTSKKSYKRLHRWRYSPTACYGNNEVHLHPYKARRISVAEALAIQSIPKNFVFPNDMSLTNMFKAIGNGVPYLLAKGIADTITSFLNNVNSYSENKSKNEFLKNKQLDLPITVLSQDM